MRRQQTAWHPLYVRFLRRVLPRGSFRVQSEVQLSQQPLRADVVVLRRRGGPPAASSILRSARVFDIAPVTVGELKGPKDVLHAADFPTLIGYTAHYMAAEGLEDPAAVQMMTVAGRLSEEYRKQVALFRYPLTEVEPGLWLSPPAPHPLCIIETEVIADLLLRFFSREVLRRPARLWDSLPTPEERAIFTQLCGDVEQFRRLPLMRLRYTDYPEFLMSLQDSIDYLLQVLPKEEVIRRYSAADRLQGIPAADRLQGIPFEEVVASLTPDVAPEVRAQVLALLRSAQQR